MCNFCNKNDRFCLEFTKIVVSLHSQLRNKATKPSFKKAKGRIPEWPNGTDCNSVVFRLRWFESIFAHKNCGSSSVDRALAFQAEGRGFEPRLPLLERIDNQKVINPFLFIYYLESSFMIL